MKANVAYVIETPLGLELCIATPEEREPFRYMIQDCDAGDIQEKITSYFNKQRRRQQWVNSIGSTS